MLKGGRRLGAANYLYVNGTSPHSLFCTVSQPSVCVCVCVCVFFLACLCDQGKGKEFFFFFFENDMCDADSHLFRGSFQTVETMLLHFATITPA